MKGGVEVLNISGVENGTIPPLSNQPIEGAHVESLTPCKLNEEEIATHHSLNRIANVISITNELYRVNKLITANATYLRKVDNTKLLHTRKTLLKQLQAEMEQLSAFR